MPRNLAKAADFCWTSDLISRNCTWLDSISRDATNSEPRNSDASASLCGAKRCCSSSEAAISALLCSHSNASIRCTSTSAFNFRNSSSKSRCLWLRSEFASSSTWSCSASSSADISSSRASSNSVSTAASRCATTSCSRSRLRRASLASSNSCSASSIVLTVALHACSRALSSLCASAASRSKRSRLLCNLSDWALMACNSLSNSCWMTSNSSRRRARARSASFFSPSTSVTRSWQFTMSLCNLCNLDSS
mmetsp:Transcript_122545/g.392152  ORF Transcript_122545/g.392152 Transcript_122545/m.392152 type:complete len:250 (+) Transcript_122545:3039-3788(+)